MRDRACPSAGSEGVKKSRKWVATVRKIRTLQHVANPISAFLHTLSAGATRSFGGCSKSAAEAPFDSLGACRSERRAWAGAGAHGAFRVRAPASPAQPCCWGEVRKGGEAPLRVR